MVYTSVGDLPYFDQFNDDLEKVECNMELNNNTSTDDSITTNRTILDQSKGSLRFSRMKTPTEKKRKMQCYIILTV